ncbi:RHS repeat-associated protein [Hydrogenophaga palleronii]|uniref:RHS repeat-associated protein n=1 Tax=Hydrogenophaga palleronii TaxID=65655 RepID=A0ABU1WTX1_9BURK|nr:RHS repeat-associated core domain-containing protein [Hydrogenophaga palleronii]MDR7152748.1 RHS repeat-associated protein [Hydrogenophaga palleronii]
MPNGFATIAQTDMSVASVGGAVNWARYWDGREWKFNPHWESLSVSWSNLTAGRMSGGDDLLIGRAGCDRLTDPDCKEPPNDNSCWVWVDEDWQPSGERVLLGGGGTSASYEFVAEPVPPIRGTPFNKIIGGDASASEYGSGTWVNADWLALCPGGGGGSASAAYSQGQELEGIRRINELYLGEGGRYAFSNRSVLERRAVREMPTTAVAQLTTGQVSAVPLDNPKGYRWIDRSGAWIDYNTQGQVVAYGERNNIPVWLVRNEAGVVRGVVDANGRVIYSLHYSGELITEVRDYPVSGLEGDLPARSVRYQYNAGNRLSEVTDVRGHVTRYGYDRSGRINRVTDAEERIETLAYKDGLVSQHTAADGGVTDYAFSYDEVNKQFNSKITGPQTAAGRRVEEQTHNRIGKLVRQVVNGRTDLEMKYDSGARIEASTNARGFTSYVQRNEFEQVTRVTDTAGASYRTSFSAIHLQPTERVDQEGFRTTYTYDDVGNLLGIVKAAGTAQQRQINIQRNVLGQIVRVEFVGRTEANGTITPNAVWIGEYDPLGQLSRITDPEGHVHQLRINRAGHLLRYTNPLGHAIRYEVDAVGRKTLETNAMGHSRSLGYDRVGNLLSVTGPGTYTWHVAYDAMNRVIQSTNPVGGVSSSEFNAQGLVVRKTDADGRSSQIEYDNFLRVVSYLDGLNNRYGVDYQIADGTTTGVLGSLFSPTEINYPSFTQLTRFDAMERPTSQSFKYLNAQGEQSVNAGVTYDKRGLVLTETDPNGSIRRYAWDAHGQPTEATDALGGKTTMGYDVRGNLIEVKDAKGNTHSFEYDRNDRLVKETRPLGQIILFEYDDSGRLNKRTNPNGHEHLYVWDAAGRVIQIEHKDSANNLLRTMVNTWDQHNNILGWTDTDHTRSDETTSAVLSYDNANRKTGETVTYPGGHSLGYGVTHSAAGKQTSLTWPDGTKIDYGYSAHGELQSVAIPGEGTISVNEYSWLQPKTVTLPGGGTQNKGYDGLLNLVSQTVRTAGQQSTLSLTNQYGRVQELQERSRTDTAGNVSSSVNEEFEYDAEIRLIKANKETGGLLGSSSEAFTLDAVANRTAHSPTTGAWQYDANNRLTKIGSGSCGSSGTVCYGYDDAGNLISKTEQNKSTQFRYDSQNRLIEVSAGTAGSEAVIAQYGYDPMNRRLWKLQIRDKAGQSLAQAKRTFYLYSDAGLVAESTELVTLNPNGSLSSQATPQITAQYGPKPGNAFTTGVLFIKTKSYNGIDSNGGDIIAYYHHDHLGAPIQATDKNGRVVWAARYEPFGKASIVTPQAMAENPTITSNLRLPGQYEDEETDLHYNWNRYYDPAIGRYVTEDPIGLSGGVNFYAYAEGSPLRLLDPEGLSVIQSPSIGGPGNSRGPDICTGTNCSKPAFDPSPNGPVPAPGPLPDPMKDPRWQKGECPEWMEKAYGGCGCPDIQPSLGACMGCCASVQGRSRSPGGVGGGSICSETCYRKYNISLEPTNDPVCTASL